MLPVPDRIRLLYHLLDTENRALLAMLRAGHSLSEAAEALSTPQNARHARSKSARPPRTPPIST